MLFVWLVLAFAGRASGDLSVPRVSELLGFSTPPVRPLAGLWTAPDDDDQLDATAAPAAGAAPSAPVAAAPVVAAPVVAAPVVAAPVVAARAPSPVMPSVVAPVNSRSRVIAPVVAPATSRAPAITPVAADVMPFDHRMGGQVASPSTAPGALAPSVAEAAAETPVPSVAAAPESGRDSAGPAPTPIAIEAGSRGRSLPLTSGVRRRRVNVVEPGADDGAADSVPESVTVISRTRRPGTSVGSWAPRTDGPPEPGADGHDSPIGSNPAMGRDLGAAARRRAVIVGSRAREVIMGYPFPAAEPAAGAPHPGAEPAPGETVVLVGDDVETWVRERLYGGRLPDR